jgi:hypothetical protein
VALDRKHGEAHSELRLLNLRHSKESAGSKLKSLFKKKED